MADDEEKIKEITSEEYDTIGFLDTIIKADDALAWETAMWGLSNICATSTNYWHRVRETSLLSVIKSEMENNTAKLSLIRVMAWAISNLAKGEVPIGMG